MRLTGLSGLSRFALLVVLFAILSACLGPRYGDRLLLEVAEGRVVSRSHVEAADGQLVTGSDSYKQVLHLADPEQVQMHLLDLSDASKAAAFGMTELGRGYQKRYDYRWLPMQLPDAKGTGHR